MSTTKISGDVTSRIFRALGANTFSQAVTVGTQLLAIPIFLTFWTLEQYGSWLILSAIPAYLALSDVGFGVVAGNEMAMRLGANDKAGAIRIYQSAWLLSAGLPGVVCGGFLVVLLVGWLGNPAVQANHAEAAAALALLAFHVFVSLQANVLQAGFRAAGQYALGVMLNSSVRLAEFMFTALALLWGAGFVGVAAMTLATRLVGTGLLAMILIRRFDWLRPSFRNASLGVLKQLAWPALSFSAFPLGLAINLQGMVMLIGVTLGASAVATFATYRTLTRVVVQVGTTLSQAAWPEISTAFGSGFVLRVQALYTKLTAYVLLCSSMVVAIILVWGEVLLQAWSRTTLPYEDVLLSLMLIGALLNVAWQPSWVLLMATNQHQPLAGLFILMSLGALLAAKVAISQFGLEGAAFAIILCEIPLAFTAVRMAAALARMGPLAYVRKSLWGWIRAA